MIKIQKSVLIFVFLLITHAVFSQTVTVRDEITNDPLGAVAVSVPGAGGPLVTDENGRVDISGFIHAERISFRRQGYRSVLKSYAEIEAAAFVVLIYPSRLNLYEIVVSGTRWREVSGDVPSRIVSVLPEERELQNPQTAADLLGLTGEVFIQKSQQGGGSPMIRGFATNRLLYTVDGVRMNTAIFRSGNIQNVISLDPFAIENTEVFFGPGSVIYGSDAIGGVMSFMTIVPEFSGSDETFIEGKAVARYSSANNEKTGHFDVSLGWKKWAMATSLSSFDYGDLRQGSNGPEDYLKPFYVERRDGSDSLVTQKDPQLQIPSAYSQTNLMQKVRFSPGKAWDLQYGFHYSETTPYGRYDRHNQTRNGVPRYGEWDYGPQVWMMNNLNINHKAVRGIYDAMTLRLALQYFEESRIDRSLNDSERHRRIEKVDAYSVNMDFVKSTGLKNKLYYGAEYVRDKVSSSGIDEDISLGTSVPGPSRYPRATWQSLAFYVTDQYKLSDKFLIQSGLRYNRFLLDAEFDTTFYPFPFSTARIDNGSLTGSLGAVFRPGDPWVISANLSTAFRSPNVDDMGKVFDSEPGSVVVPNPDLKAEYAYNADLSLTRLFGNWLKIDLTGYYTWLENAMVRRDFTLNGMEYIEYDGVLSRVQAVQNAASATVLGLQAGIEVKLPGGFGFSSDINLQEGEEELDDGTVSPSRHAGPWFGITRLSYNSDRVDMQVYLLYQGELKHGDMPEEEKEKTEIYALDPEGNTYAPGWCTVNFKTRVRLTPHLSINAGIENITDRRYRPYSSGISGSCRNFILSLTARF